MYVRDQPPHAALVAEAVHTSRAFEDTSPPMVSHDQSRLNIEAFQGMLQSTVTRHEVRVQARVPWTYSPYGLNLDEP